MVSDSYDLEPPGHGTTATSNKATVSVADRWAMLNTSGLEVGESARGSTFAATVFGDRSTTGFGTRLQRYVYQVSPDTVLKRTAWVKIESQAFAQVPGTRPTMGAGASLRTWFCLRDGDVKYVSPGLPFPPPGIDEDGIESPRILSATATGTHFDLILAIPPGTTSRLEESTNFTAWEARPCFEFTSSAPLTFIELPYPDTNYMIRLSPGD